MAEWNTVLEVSVAGRCIAKKPQSCLIEGARVAFFFNDTGPPEIYPLSLHDALPISFPMYRADVQFASRAIRQRLRQIEIHPIKDRKSTRLNSSHMSISYAVFCL